MCILRSRIFLLVFAIIFSNIGSVSLAADKKQEPKIITSYADIIEPLLPMVVNIYTIKYARKVGNPNHNMREIFPFEHFNDFFERFNVPFTFDELYSNPRAMSLGSGLIVDEDGLIVTNHHVVAGSDEVSIKFHDNTELPAKVIGTDPKTDLALLKVDTKKKLTPVKFGDAGSARVGDVVIAIGNPLGFGGTVTTGIISSKGRDIGSGLDELVDDFIQTDAAINSGNSGGPLFNIDGEVIGVNTAIPAAGGGTNIGIGFAIPSNTVQDIITKLEQNGKVRRGRLDITIQSVTKELADALGFEYDYGVLIVDVKPGGAGHRAGLRRGDLIVEYNENKVPTVRKLQLFVADSEIGEKVKLGVIREGKKIVLSADIVEVAPDDNSRRRRPEKLVPSLEIAGIYLSNMSAGVISNYDLDPSTKGIVVTDLIEDELAIDLSVGDVILSINQQRIDDVDQFKVVYEKAKEHGKSSVVLLVKRRDYTRFVAFPVTNGKQE